MYTSATDNAADGLTVAGCREFSIDAATTAFVSILGNCDRLCIMDNFVVQGATGNVGHFLIMSSKVCLGARILRNMISVTGAANATVGVFMTGSSTTSSGVCAFNLCRSLDTTGALFCTATLTFALFENYYTGDVAASGLLWPAADNPA